MDVSISTQPLKSNDSQSGRLPTVHSSQWDSAGDLNTPARYIVVLNTAPVSQALNRLRSSNSIRSSNRKEAPKRASYIRSHMKNIQDEQDQTVDAIFRNSWALEIEAHLKIILNGFIIKARPSQVKSIESMSQVRSVYLSPPIQLTIQSSVPSIGAHHIWNILDGDGNPVSDPGYSESAITVGASDDSGYVISSSSRGYYGRIKPDVLAPGNEITSTTLNLGWESMTGTSMAAPHAAGAAALLKQLHPDLTPNQIKARLMNTALTHGLDPFTEGAGRIRVDLAATVEMMLWPSSLMLGYVAYEQDTWSSVSEFDLTNSSSTTRSYQLNVEPLRGAHDHWGKRFDVDPSRYDISLSRNSVILNPGESTQLSISVNIHPNTLYPPAQLPQAYFSAIAVNDGYQEIRLPFAFLYSRFRQIEGWPVWANGGSSPLIVDLDNDGDNEAVTQTTNGIIVYRHDGIPLTGWPKSPHDVSGGAPVAGNIDGDGDLEIVVSSGGKNITAYHHDGSVVDGWPVQLSLQAYYPILADFDADGCPEVVVGTMDTTPHRRWTNPVPYVLVYAFNGSGSSLPGWPVTIYEDSSYHAVPLAVDLNGDKRMEIVWPTLDLLFAFNSDGSLVEGWPVSHTAGTRPIAGDMDGDGDIEIALNSSAQLEAWHHDGSVVEGWPVKEQLRHSFGSPVFADLDTDGDLEIIMTISYDNNPQTHVLDYRHGIHAYHHDGTPVSGLPIAFPDIEWVHYPMVGDLDGDGKQELLFVLKEESNELIYLCAYHQDGLPVKGFPISGHFSGHPTLGDLDGDGDIDILMGGSDSGKRSFRTGLLHAFDLTGAYNPSNIDWGSWRHNVWGNGNFHHGSSARSHKISNRARPSGTKPRIEDYR